MKFCDAFCEVIVTLFHITTTLRVLTQVKSDSGRFTGKEVFLSSPHSEVILPVLLPSTIYVALSCCPSILLFDMKLQVIRTIIIDLIQQIF